MRVNVQRRYASAQRLNDGSQRASHWLPSTCGVFGFGLVVFVWGSLAKASIGSDEAAYLLQAKIFASGRLVASGRPLPEFFQQFHVFVTPVLAGKYPPGHALLLTLGIWLGLPGFVPALSTAIMCAALCVLAQRFADDLTAALTVGLATTSDIALRFNPSYFSETTTAMALVVSWWAILRYWETGRARWLALCGAACALGAITRPLTLLACGIPILILVVGIVGRRRTWTHLLPAFLMAAFILGFSAVWNARVTGHWYRLPWAEYARLYAPSDRLGFGPSPDSPAAPSLTTDEKATAEVYRRLHANYTIRDVPAAASDRAANIIRGTWSYGGVPGLAILVAVGLIPLAVFRLTLGTVLCVFVAYLFFAIPPTWNLYYLELQAPLGFFDGGRLGWRDESRRSLGRQASPCVGGQPPSGCRRRARLGDRLACRTRARTNLELPARACRPSPLSRTFSEGSRQPTVATIDRVRPLRSRPRRRKIGGERPRPGDRARLGGARLRSSQLGADGISPSTGCLPLPRVARLDWVFVHNI